MQYTSVHGAFWWVLAKTRRYFYMNTCAELTLHERNSLELKLLEEHTQLYASDPYYSQRYV